MTQMNEYELEGEQGYGEQGYGEQGYGQHEYGEQGELQELEGEQFLGGLLRGVGGLLGLGQGESEGAQEYELEGEQGYGQHEYGEQGELQELEGEQFLGGLLRGVGGLLGLGQGESGGAQEYELEGEQGYGQHEYGQHEFELEGEQFFGAIRRLVKKVAPILGRVAQVALPVLKTAVAGPLGSAIGAASGLLGEGELEGEFEGAGEYELELEFESPQSAAQQLAELMAATASGAQTELEAEAMVGAAVTLILSPQERSELRRILPYLVRGAALLARILRRRPETRMFVRTVPTIISSTARSLVRGQQAGRPVSRARAARVMAAQTRQILQPGIAARSLARNISATRRSVRSQPRDRRGRFAPVRG
jgi:hypothetical protein